MAYYDIGYEFRKSIVKVVTELRQLRLDLNIEIEDIKSDRNNAELEYDGKYYLRDDVVDRLTDLEHCVRDLDSKIVELEENYLNHYDE